MPNFKPDICPNCGREMIQGVLRIYAHSGASLYWESDDRHPQKSFNPFRLAKMIPQKHSKHLLDGYSLIYPENQEEGWHCPDCGLVFARFKTDKKDASL